jgi:hypothetical protein
MDNGKCVGFPPPPHIFTFGVKLKLFIGYHYLDLDSMGIILMFMIHIFLKIQS